MKIREACKKLTTAAKRSANCQLPSPRQGGLDVRFIYLLSFECGNRHCIESFAYVDKCKLLSLMASRWAKASEWSTLGHVVARQGVPGRCWRTGLASEVTVAVGMSRGC